jgi:hypothetical protein
MKVLNIGAGGKGIPIPPHYQGWDIVRLDIAPEAEPDILLDARQLATLPAEQFDAAYSNHFLEHMPPWELAEILKGMRHIIKPEGWIETRVPDLLALIRLVATDKLDVDSFVYSSPGGNIHVDDIIFGFAPYRQRSEFMAHKTGFSEGSLVKLLKVSGFARVWSASKQLELCTYAFTQDPSPFARDLLKLP